MTHLSAAHGYVRAVVHATEQKQKITDGCPLAGWAADDGTRSWLGAAERGYSSCSGHAPLGRCLVGQHIMHTQPVQLSTARWHAVANRSPRSLNVSPQLGSLCSGAAAGVPFVSRAVRSRIVEAGDMCGRCHGKSGGGVERERQWRRAGCCIGTRRAVCCMGHGQCQGRSHDSGASCRQNSHSPRRRGRRLAAAASRHGRPSLTADSDGLGSPRRSYSAGAGVQNHLTMRGFKLRARLPLCASGWRVVGVLKFFNTPTTPVAWFGNAPAVCDRCAYPLSKPAHQKRHAKLRKKLRGD